MGYTSATCGKAVDVKVGRMLLTVGGGSGVGVKVSTGSKVAGCVAVPSRAVDGSGVTTCT
jgi:hypothetical protein